MLKTTANFDTYNQTLNNKPVWVIDIDGISTKFCSGTFSGIDSNYKKYGKELNRTAYKVDLLRFHTEFPGYTAKIIDDSSNTLAGIIFTNNLVGVRVDIYTGFQELALTDFNHTYGYIASYSFGKDKEITIEINHKFKALERPIFRGLAVTELTADETMGALSINVTDASKFQDGTINPSDSPWGITDPAAVAQNPKASVLVDGELYPYKVKDATSFTRVTSGTTSLPAYYGFEYKNIVSGAKVYEVMILNGYMFMEAILQILTTTAAGTNGDWDLGLTGWGLGIDVNDVDIIQITNELGPWGKWAHWSTPGTYSPETTLSIYVDPHKNPVDNALEWMEKNLLPQLPGVFIITENGKLGIKVYEPPAMAESDIILIQDYMELPTPNQDNDKFITHLEVERKYSGVTNELATEYCSTLITTLFDEKERVKLKLNSPEGYVDNDNFTNAYLFNYIHRLFGTLGMPRIRSMFKAHATYQNLQPMDKVSISHDKLINLNTPNTLKTQWYEMGNIITSIGIDYKAGPSPVQIECEYPLEYLAGANKLNRIQVYNQDDLDVYTLAISTDIDEGTLEAADAYVDFDATYYFPDGSYEATFPAYHVGFRFKLTQPGEAGGNEYGSFCVAIIRAQDPAGTDIKYDEKRLYYDETSDEEVFVDMWLLNVGGGTHDYLSRARADFYGISGTHAPTLELYQVKLWQFFPQETMTSSVVKG